MSNSFLTCLRIVETAEGGWSNDPADPGGATMVGVTLRAWRAFMQDDSLTPQQLYDMTESDRQGFYRAMYWQPMNGDALPLGINLMAFDTAVNCGVYASSIILQTALGFHGKALDGNVGPKTMATVKSTLIPALLIHFTQLRLKHYAGLSGFPRFGKGWTARAQRILAISQHMLDGTIPGKLNA